MDDDEQWQKTDIMIREEKKRPSNRTKEGVKTNEDNERKGRIYDLVFSDLEYDQDVRLTLIIVTVEDADHNGSFYTPVGRLWEYYQLRIRHNI